MALLAEDARGAGREGDDLASHLDAFDFMRAEATNLLVVGDADGEVVACYQMSVLTGLSRRAVRRALIEGVRVAAPLRGLGIGSTLMTDAEARSRAAGCGLIQLFTHRSRTRAHAFYERLGFTPSHTGFRRDL